MQTFLTFGPLTHIALLGASPLFAPLKAWGGERGIKVTILTAPAQREYVDADLQPLVTDALNSELRQSHLKECSLALSFGARWIMKEKIRRELFCDAVVNCHGTRLPFDRGGGNWSYRAMRGDRLGCLMLHKIDDGIDTGPIIRAEDYVIPRDAITPAQMRSDYLKRLLPFLIDFLECGVSNAAIFHPQYPPAYLGSYYPRLDTATHGMIDWGMDPHDLIRFIDAFDDPYAGAGAYIQGRKIHLKKCQLHGGEQRCASWMSGIVVRRSDRYIVVALRDGWSLIVESISDECGNDMLHTLKEGDRLSADPHQTRAKFGAVKTVED